MTGGWGRCRSKVQASSCKVSTVWDLTHSRVRTANGAVLRTCKWMREQIINVLTTFRHGSRGMGIRSVLPGVREGREGSYGSEKAA